MWWCRVLWWWWCRWCEYSKKANRPYKKDRCKCVGRCVKWNKYFALSSKIGLGAVFVVVVGVIFFFVHLYLCLCVCVFMLCCSLIFSLDHSHTDNKGNSVDQILCIYIYFVSYLLRSRVDMGSMFERMRLYVSIWLSFFQFLCVLFAFSSRRFKLSWVHQTEKKPNI